MIKSNTSGEAKSILLVDDDSSSAKIYSTRLEQAGFRTTSAPGVGEACEALPNVPADLIIVDLMLPNPGVLELLQAIRLDDRHKNTPVLLLSNSYLPELTKKALRVSSSRALPRSECTTAELVSLSRSLVGITGAGGDDPTALGQDAGPTDSDSTEDLRMALTGRAC